MKVLKNVLTGKYYKKGAGFSVSKDQATQVDECEANKVKACSQDMGLAVLIECAPCTPDEGYIQQNEDGSSYAVYFVRKKDINWCKGVDKNPLNPSKRRFKTWAEAWSHGQRYVNIEKHLGCWVLKHSNEPVNSWINQVTGFTNPEKGKKRLCRTGK